MRGTWTKNAKALVWHHELLMAALPDQRYGEITVYLNLINSSEQNRPTIRPSERLYLSVFTIGEM